MITVLEDLSRVLDRTSESYRHGRRPPKQKRRPSPGVPRAVAADLNS